MPFSIRLRLDPIYDPESTEEAPQVIGGTVSFTTRGAELTQAKLDATSPAKLTFVGRFTKSVRDRPSPEEFPLGELSGSIRLRGKPPTVTFSCDAESLRRLTEQPEEEETEDDTDKNPPFSPRSLTLQFDASFLGPEKLKESTPQLWLPKESGQFRYLEVCARLEVSSALEAEFEQNDILDVLIRPVAPKAYPFSL